MSSYVVWANKGGIGKSTMTFQLACETAEAHPNKSVLVIDLSPQCDVSRMLLGGGHYRGEDTILSLMHSTPRLTIQSYLSECLNNVPSGTGWPDPNNFIIDPSNYRPTTGHARIPRNLRLLCGDFDLERTIQLIEQLPQPPRRSGRAPTGPEYSTYLLVRSFLRYAVEILTKNNNCIVFIDTDPYFNVITTHMGLVAARYWISAYSPSSQASQFAVLRSIEFMFDQTSGLRRFISDEQHHYPNPWFDNRGNPLSLPLVSVAEPYLLLANMVNPYRQTGSLSYTDPQHLHAQTIQQMEQNTLTEAARHQVQHFAHYEHMWDLRRIGLICDYNGVGLHSLTSGRFYGQPATTRRYKLNSGGGTPNQLRGYKARLNRISSLL